MAERESPQFATYINFGVINTALAVEPVRNAGGI